MKAATIHELKLELSNAPAEQLAELCIRLAKFKKENKELLTYLLFEAFDEQAYIENIKIAMLVQFQEINTSSIYFIKKSLRKILRTLNKYIRYTGSAETEVKLPVVFEGVILESGLKIDMLVEKCVIVELKSVESMNPVFEAQLMTYLRLSKTRLGFLINFNVPHLKNGIKRIVL